MFALLAGLRANAQQQLTIGSTLQAVGLHHGDTLKYRLELKKGGTYRLQAEQQGIAVAIKLFDAAGRLVVQSRRPEDITGWLKSEYSPLADGAYLLQVCRYPDPENTSSGKFTLQVSALSAAELTRRKNIKRELAAENRKMVLTADIDHFWEAFDALRTCKTKADSLKAVQMLYLDRATDGLIDFIAARDITAERLVQQIGRHPKFYASVRPNTYTVKGREGLIRAVYDRFSGLYKGFKPFKVCFAIGIANTGGTVSNEFVLIGTEVMASSKTVDVSEFIRDKDLNKAALLSAGGNFDQKIRDLVAHESVHTQQLPLGEAAKQCPLLTQILKEGICDFVGKLLVGRQINARVHTYGDQHEKELWEELRSASCSGDIGRWLYNGHTSIDRPADLGYYMGYRIAAAYYARSDDKLRAIADMIGFRDPELFLKDSGYAELMQSR
jgi:hypothetical protein